MRIEQIGPEEAREKLAGVLEVVKEVEKDLYRLSSKIPEFTQICQELVEASEGIDRGIENLDEIIMGVT